MKLKRMILLALVLLTCNLLECVNQAEGKTPQTSTHNNHLHADHNNNEFSHDENEDEEDYEDPDYDDQDPTDFGEESQELDEDDAKTGAEVEHGASSEESHKRPKMGKCCPLDEALNIHGACHPIPHKRHHNLWYPERVFGNSGHIEELNISNWDVSIAHKVNCLANESSEVISEGSKFVLIYDGSLYLTHTKMTAKPLEFCVDQQYGHKEHRVVKSCFTKYQLCDDSQCLRKCCPEDTIVEEFSFKCIKNPNPKTIEIPKSHLRLIHGPPVCTNGQKIVEIEDETKFNISSGGSLIIGSVETPFLNYCMDNFAKSKGRPKSNNDIHESEKSNIILKAMICYTKDESESDDRMKNSGLIELPKWLSILIGIAMIISAIFLALAALITLRLPELRSLYGKCQLSHLGTLFFLCSLLAIVNLENDHLPNGLCTLFAVLIHICALSSFMWLNLLCFNIYLTFRSLRPPLSGRRDENKRLFFLCVYAWGIPTAFCTFLYILDKSGRIIDPMPRPGYGELRCLISSRSAEFAYLFGPVGFLLLCNAVMFCLTAKELLCGLWRLDNSDSISFRRKSMGIVVAKLGMVMGMGWILDILSWAVSDDYPYFFYAADFFNCLQGLFIFIVLICRKRVLEILRLRKPSITKEETLTVRPFLARNSINSPNNHTDHDTSLVLVQDS